MGVSQLITQSKRVQSVQDRGDLLSVSASSVSDFVAESTHGRRCKFTHCVHEMGLSPGGLMGGAWGLAVTLVAPFKYLMVWVHKRLECKSRRGQDTGSFQAHARVHSYGTHTHTHTCMQTLCTHVHTRACIYTRTLSVRIPCTCACIYTHSLHTLTHTYVYNAHAHE